MRLIAYEAKKIVCIPALWGFLALSFLFNVLLMSGQGYEHDYFNQLRTGAEESGYRADEEDNVFAGYHTENLAAFYENIVRESPVAVRWVERKYALLQPRVEHLAESGAALDFYAGDATCESHQFLFGALMRAMLAEGSICAMFVVLYLMGYEQMNRTAGQVCASRIGRKLWGNKLTAAVWCVLSIVLLLSPVLVRDRLCRTRSLQWSSGCGRSILRMQIIAACIAAFVVTAVNMTVYGIPFLRQNPLIFKDCGLESLWGSATPWFDWTYGTYLIILGGLIVVLSMAAALLTVFFSQYSGNYIPMLLKALPLFVVSGPVAGSWMLYNAFYFRELWQGAKIGGFCGMEAVMAAFLLTLGAGLCVTAVVRQRRAELC